MKTSLQKRVKIIVRMLSSLRVRYCVALVCVALLAGALSIPTSAYAANEESGEDSRGSGFYQQATIAALLDEDRELDGKNVQFEGEAIGDILSNARDADMRWVTFKPKNALTNETVAVWMSREDSEKISHLGKYNVEGTVLRVEGVFNTICSEHEGQTDVHAHTVAIVSEGAVFQEEFEIALFVPGIISVVAGLIFMGLYYSVRRRQR